MHSLQPTDQLQTSRAVCTFTYHCSSVTGTVRASCHNRAPELGTEERLSYGHRWRTVHSCSMTEVEHWNVRCLRDGYLLSWCYNRSANYDWSSTHQIVLGTHIHENDEMANLAVYLCSSIQTSGLRLGVLEDISHHGSHTNAYCANWQSAPESLAKQRLI